METTSSFPVRESATPVQRNSNAQMMKNIQKARLQRKAMVEPGFVSELVRLQSTAVYNASGDIVQTASASLGNA